MVNPPKLVFSMRDTMPYFVCSLRQVDEWKRQQAKRAQVFAQAEYDVNAKYIKSPFARSLKIEDVLRFLDDTVLDINFMVQLPSIELGLNKWWALYAPGSETTTIGQEQLRQVYYDLAYVLVQGKTENIHKNSVSMILRAAWTKWSPKEPPLTKREFFRLLFILAHLMTESNRLNEYVMFFQETLGVINRTYQSKAKRMEQRRRQPRVRRKASISVSGGMDSPDDLLSTARRLSSAGLGALGGFADMHVDGRMESVNGSVDRSEGHNDVSSESRRRGSLIAAGHDANGANNGLDRDSTCGEGRYRPSGTRKHAVDADDDNNRGVAKQMLSVNLHHVAQRLGLDLNGDESTSNCFIAVLERGGVRSSGQHLEVDPQLLDRRFQDKLRHGSGAASSSSSLSTSNSACGSCKSRAVPSMNDIMRERNPVSNRYMPPLSIVRLRATTASVRSPSLNQVPALCQSSPSILVTPRSTTAKTTGLPTTVPRCNNKPAAIAQSEDSFDEKSINAALRSLTHSKHKGNTTINEGDAMRRSLSSVTLRKRVAENKSKANAHMDGSGASKSAAGSENEGPIYLAIST